MTTLTDHNRRRLDSLLATAAMLHRNLDFIYREAVEITGERGTDGHTFDAVYSNCRSTARGLMLKIREGAKT